MGKFDQKYSGKNDENNKFGKRTQLGWKDEVLLVTVDLWWIASSSLKTK